MRHKEKCKLSKPPNKYVALFLKTIVCFRLHFFFGTIVVIGLILQIIGGPHAIPFYLSHCHNTLFHLTTFQHNKQNQCLIGAKHYTEGGLKSPDEQP